MTVYDSYHNLTNLLIIDILVTFGQSDIHDKKMMSINLFQFE